MAVFYPAPRVLAFDHVLRASESRVPVRLADGSVGARMERRDPGLTLDVGFLGPDQSVIAAVGHTFGTKEDELPTAAALCEAAGVNQFAIWENAFNALRPKFAGLAEGDSAGGVPFYMRVESVKGNFALDGPRGMVFSVGLYTGSDWSGLANVLEVSFLDAWSRKRRAAKRIEDQESLANLEARAAGTDPSQASLQGEALTRAMDAAEGERVVKAAQFAASERALVGALEDVLLMPEVAAAFGAITGAAFTSFKTRLPNWAAVDVDLVMSRFAEAMAEIVAVSDAGPADPE